MQAAYIMILWKLELIIIIINSVKSIFSKLSLHLRFKSEGHRNGLVNIYKDVESFSEYEDIRVKWKMIQIQSSILQYTRTIKRINSSSYWILCFRST
ncbi:hypothetical protein CR513_28527, partial [Mucuna pruriens]